MFEEMNIGIAIRDYLANQGDERRERDYLKFYEEYLKRYRTFDELKGALEKAEKYDAHEWVTKETPEGITLEIYHIDSLATAHDDKRKAERKLEDATNWLIKAKAEGRISMNAGFSLGLVLGIEEE